MPTRLWAFDLCRSARAKVQDDSAKTQGIFRNEWRGFVDKDSARRSKWILRTTTKKWCEVIVCATQEDIAKQLGAARGEGSWCLVAKRAKTDVDLNTAWCLLEFIGNDSLKDAAPAKTSPYRFNSSWKEAYADLRMLGIWREAYCSKNAS